MSQEKRDDRKLKLKAQYIDSNQGKKFAKKMEQLNNETNEVVNSYDDIVSLRKEEGRDVVNVEMSNGDEYRFTPNQYTQLFYDKVEKQNMRDAAIEADIDKTRIEVLPFQNKIQYMDGNTNEFLGQIMIDTALQYEMKDKVTGQKINYSKELNPAILALLDEDKNTQKAYMQGNKNLEIVYDFSRKSPIKQENKKNKKIAKIMDKFFQLETKYMERKARGNSPIKIGFASLKDRIKSFFNAPVKKVDDKAFYEEVRLDDLMKMNENSFIANGNDDPTVKLKAVTEEDIKREENKEQREELKNSIDETADRIKQLEQIDEINKIIEQHSIVIEDRKKAEEEKQKEQEELDKNMEIVDLAECTIEDREGNIVLDTKENEDIKREKEKELNDKIKDAKIENYMGYKKKKIEDIKKMQKEFGNVGKVNHMGYKKNAMPGYRSNKKKREEKEER